MCASLGISQDLTLEPYNKFQSLLSDNAVGTDIGNSLREEVFSAGMAHHLLHSLSLAGHHPVRCKEKVRMKACVCGSF